MCKRKKPIVITDIKVESVSLVKQPFYGKRFVVTPDKTSRSEHSAESVDRGPRHTVPPDGTVCVRCAGLEQDGWLCTECSMYLWKWIGQLVEDRKNRKKLRIIGIPSSGGDGIL